MYSYIQEETLFDSTYADKYEVILKYPTAIKLFTLEEVLRKHQSFNIQYIFSTSIVCNL